MSSDKLNFQGKIVSIQPRIRLTRSFDERRHNYLGYNLMIDGKIIAGKMIAGKIDDEEAEVFTVGIGKATQSKYKFKYGDIIQGQCLSPKYPYKEPAEYYKTSHLSIIEESTLENVPPLWHGVPPTLEEYRDRGHRRLSKRTYNAKCTSCIWGCCMAVEIIIDHWNPDKKEYRTETFCYGPKSCEYYKAGPNRKVPGRKGMVWKEPDWVDEEATSHRGTDE